MLENTRPSYRCGKYQQPVTSLARDHWAPAAVSSNKWQQYGSWANASVVVPIFVIIHIEYLQSISGCDEFQYVQQNPIFITRKGDNQRQAAVEKRSEKWKAKKKRKEHKQKRSTLKLRRKGIFLVDSIHPISKKITAIQMVR